MFFPDLPADVKRLLEQALLLMKRDRPVRRAPATRRPITHIIRRQIHVLSGTDLTEHEIANEVGIRNSGRVSEVLNGKR
jgi:hypothetical protein